MRLLCVLCSVLVGAAASTCYLLTRDEEGDGTQWVPRHKQRGKVVG
jgi:hypothetical protein